MNEKELKSFLEKLQEYEQVLSDDNGGDLTTIQGINDLLKDLSEASSETYGNYPQSSGLRIRVKKLTEDAVIPFYSKPGDAGMDLTVTSVEEGETNVKYGFGLAYEIPEGYVGLIFPRSSVMKYDLLLTNCVGVIDSKELLFQ